MNNMKAISSFLPLFHLLMIQVNLPKSLSWKKTLQLTKKEVSPIQGESVNTLNGILNSVNLTIDINLSCCFILQMH